MTLPLSVRIIVKLCGCLALVLSAAAAIAEPSPKLKASVQAPQTVTLSIRSSSRRRTTSTLVVTRAVNGSGRFTKIANIKVAGTSTLSLSDSLSTNVHKVTYRSRLTGRTRSRWSKRVTVVVHETKPVDEDTSPPDLDPTPEEETPVTTKPDVTLPSGFTACNSAATNEVLSLANAARQAIGIGLLSFHSQLAVSSQTFSKKLAIASSLSHDGWYENIVASGYRGNTFGQNIGYSSSLSARTIFNGWMNSEGHRKNILSPTFHHIGIGCVMNPSGFVWWTQDFGG